MPLNGIRNAVAALGSFVAPALPVSSLFENLESDVSVTEYVDAFEGVTIEQVRRVLAHVARSALAPTS